MAGANIVKTMLAGAAGKKALVDPGLFDKFAQTLDRSSKRLEGWNQKVSFGGRGGSDPENIAKVGSFVDKLGASETAGDIKAFATGGWLGLLKNKVSTIGTDLSAGFGGGARDAKAGSHMLNAAGNMALLTPGLNMTPLGPMISSFGKLGSIVLDNVDKLKKWGDTLHESNMRFAEFSGAMSQVQAEQQMRDMYLSKSKGDELAESAGELARAKSRVARDWAPVESLVQKMQNWVGVFVNNLAHYATKIGTFGLLGGEEAGEGATMPANEWMWKVAEEQWYETYGRPKRTNK